MGKFILLLSFLGISILFTLGLTNPASSVMWLASSTFNFAMFRLAMLIILASLLATHPPRHAALRVLVGGFALSSIAWTISQTLSYSINILDTLSILQFGISTIIIVLESKRFSIEDQKSHQERILAVRNARMSLQISPFKVQA